MNPTLPPPTTPTPTHQPKEKLDPAPQPSLPPENEEEEQPV